MNNDQFRENNGAQWNAPEAHWSGSNYSSGSSKPPKPPKQPKEKKTGASIKVTVIACVCSCLVASAASVGGFAALVGSGAISLGNSSGGATTTISASTSSSSGSAASTAVSAAADGTLQSAAEKALQSSVLIQTYATGSANNYYYGFSFGQQDETESLYSEGSGVIATSDGYIITNAHVIDGASSIKVTLQSGDTYTAEVVGSDTVTDLALLKIDEKDLAAAEFGTSSDLQVGDSVIAVGNPGGSSFESSATFGYISALNRTVTTSTEYQMTCIQTDAAINPGNSGGALVNSAGQVIGITSSKIVDESYEGLGFAIPVDSVLSVINDLREYGYVANRAVLGITGQFVDSVTAQYYGFSTGFYVSTVDNDSAKEAGLTRGDIITKVDETEITSQAVLTSLLLDKAPGDTVTLTVDRNGEAVTLDVTLQAYSAED